MMLIPVLALLVGILIGGLLGKPIGNEAGLYIAVACIAGLDTICGGLRSYLEGKFHQDIFVTGFASNILIAFFLAWLGDNIGINLFLAIAVILGGRIFTNLSILRRQLLTRWQDAQARQRAQRIAAQQPQQPQPAQQTTTA